MTYAALRDFDPATLDLVTPEHYERNGYPEACRVRDFYKPGDDLIIMIKAL